MTRDEEIQNSRSLYYGLIENTVAASVKLAVDNERSRTLALITGAFHEAHKDGNEGAMALLTNLRENVRRHE